MAGEPLVQQDNKQVQVDLQDLGYETCGRSETEADREETTSPGRESRPGPGLPVRQQYWGCLLCSGLKQNKILEKPVWSLL